MTIRTRAHEQDGVVTIWMIALAGVTMLMTLLVVDGARVMGAATATGDTARAAARAGAGAVDPVSRTIVASLAIVRVEALAAAQGTTVDHVAISPDGQQITVTIRTTIDLPRLALLGIPSTSTTATASATILHGETTP